MLTRATQPPGSRAFTLVEVLLVAGLVCLLVSCLTWFFAFSSRSTSRLTAQLGLQQASRMAVVRFLRELQEGIELVSPAPGCTLSYALVRDKVSLLRWYFLRPQPGERGTHELWRYVHDPALPTARREELMLRDIRRLTFTSQSQGAVQVNLLLARDGQEYATLTLVRLRNLAAAEELW